jgi:hemoglobin
MGNTLYERLGGAQGIEAVVDDFYDRVLDDESLAGYFEDMDMAQLREHQQAFITMVAGGPQYYDGRDMREAHAHLDLDESDFEAVAGHLEDALAAAGVADEDRTTVLSAVEDIEDQVLDR